MSWDLFYLFRYLLCLVCGVYALTRICQGMWRWRRWLWADHGTAGMLRSYLLLQLVRTRLRRHSLDILQVVILIVVFWQLILLHRRM